MRAVGWCQKRSNVRKIKETINAAQRMIRWHKLFNRERIKQRALRHLPRSHHRRTSTLKTSEPGRQQPIKRLCQQYLSLLPLDGTFLNDRFREPDVQSVCGCERV